MPVTFQDIQKAAKIIHGKVAATPCIYSKTLSQITGAEVYLKFENLQYTASFKERGALVKLISLTDDQRKKGIIAMSAGNHAQAVAYHAQQLNIPAIIVMPRITPDIKIEHTRAFGAEVLLEGDSYDVAADVACKIAKERDLTLIHPYDDEKIIAGQGTIAIEMMTAQPQLDVLVIPIGGGGLIAGNSLAAKAIKPEITIVGVETARYPSMFNELISKPAKYGESTIAEGIAVKHSGKMTLPIVKELVDEILLVDEEDIENSVELFLEVEKTVVEGAGAVGLAALLLNRDRFSEKNVGIIISGGNIDMPVLSDIIQRGLVRSGRMTRIRVKLRDVAGMLSKVTSCIENDGARIVKVHHHRTFTKQPVQYVEVEFILRTRGIEHIQEVLSSLEQAGYEILNTTK